MVQQEKNSKHVEIHNAFTSPMLRAFHFLFGAFPHCSSVSRLQGCISSLTHGRTQTQCFHPCPSAFVLFLQFCNCKAWAYYVKFPIGNDWNSHLPTPILQLLHKCKTPGSNEWHSRQQSFKQWTCIFQWQPWTKLKLFNVQLLFLIRACSNQC